MNKISLKEGNLSKNILFYRCGLNEKIKIFLRLSI